MTERANNISWVLDLIRYSAREKFSGNIQVNFQFGGVTNLSKTQTFKPPKLEDMDKAIIEGIKQNYTVDSLLKK